MKALRLFLLTIVINQSTIITCSAQAGEWTWMGGDNYMNSPGYYGTQGIPSVFNQPGARYACGYWVDTAGNFWVYSGVNNNDLNSDDLWKFDAQTLMWTWMKGSGSLSKDTEVITANINVFNSQNSPGSLGWGMFTWVTPDNHLWLFGGANNLGVKSDLWQFDPAVNQWAWMGNFSARLYGTLGIGTYKTMPGGRSEGNCAWSDSSGNLWLFGGTDVQGGSLNDVWQYNVTSAIWTWMSGSNVAADPGIYGVVGQSSVDNYPAARSTNLFWKDDEGNFWLGGGTQNMPYYYMFQDIWKFNPHSLEWTWVKGEAGNDTISIGTNCISDTLNKMGPRYENRAVWKICDDLIINGGGFIDYYNTGELTDLWAYKISTNKWLKINSWDAQGNYGSAGVPGIANSPPARIGSVGFKDKNNNIWLFAGLSIDSSSGDYNYFNDLWEYVLDTTCVESLLCNDEITIGIVDLKREEQVLLYPNPSTGSWQLTVSSELVGSALEVFDDEGRLVLKDEVRTTKYEITAPTLAKGIYWLRISNESVSVVRKMVKI